MMLAAHEMTPEQRAAVESARQILAPHFGGHTVRVYVPKRPWSDRRQRESAILEALAGGAAVPEVVSTWKVSRSYVYRLARLARAGGS